MLRTILLALVFAATMWCADISGTWYLTVETSAGSGTPTFVFQQSGEKLTGTYSGALGEAKVTGTVKGDDVEFSFEVSATGEKATVRYVGKLEGDTRMKGAVDLAGMGEGTFTGQKKK